MPPTYPLGDVTSLLSVKVRPRLNKGLNHCLCIFIIAVHRAFVLGLGAQHRGIVKLSEGG